MSTLVGAVSIPIFIVGLILALGGAWHRSCQTSTPTRTGAGVRESEKKVGRADNNLEGARSAANEQPIDQPQPDEISEDPREGDASAGSEGSAASLPNKRRDR